MRLLEIRDVRKCSRCGAKSQVFDTRVRGKLLCRYRCCPECGYRWKTCEIDVWEYEKMIDEADAQKGGGYCDAE